MCFWNENRQAGWQQTEWKQDELTFHCNNPQIQTIIWLFHDLLVNLSHLFLFMWLFIPWCFDLIPILDTLGVLI